MIRLVEPSRHGVLTEICRNSVLGARILSGVRMYGQYPFADAWVQETDVLAAALFRMDGALTVHVCGEPDWDELCEFLHMGVGESVLGEAWVLEKLNVPGTQGPILTCKTPVQTPSQPLEPPRLKDVHELLYGCREETFQVPEWEPFYLDLSHRLRHGGAHLETLSEQGVLIACAMTVAETQETAILGAVAVRAGHRGQGLGSGVVRRLLARLPQPQAAVLCTSGGNERFYESLGFTVQARWCEGTL